MNQKKNKVNLNKKKKSKKIAFRYLQSFYLNHANV